MFKERNERRAQIKTNELRCFLPANVFCPTSPTTFQLVATRIKSLSREDAIRRSAARRSHGPEGPSPQRSAVGACRKDSSAQNDVYDILMTIFNIPAALVLGISYRAMNNSA